MSYLTDNPTIKADLEWLLKNDQKFIQYFGDDFTIQRDKGEEGMAGLIRIVVGQQVSTSAAQSIWQKVISQFDPYDPAVFLEATEDDLRACGLSRPKIKYIKGLAQAITDKDIDIPSWNNKDTSQVTGEITFLKGFGLWSAHMFLMFNLARPDVWPCGDLGIQIGLQTYLGADDRPNEKETAAQAHLFKGRETAAALLLWSIKEGGV